MGMPGVLTRPSLGFFRLAADGGRLWPVVFAGLAGLLVGGAEPLKGLVFAALGGLPGGAWWSVAGFAVLFPLYYAGAVAGIALAGWLVGGRAVGLGWRDLYWRVWRVLGWCNLPLLLPTFAFFAYLFTAGRAVLGAMAAGVVPGTIPSFGFSVGQPVVFIFGLAGVWTIYLLLIGLRQAISGTTWRTWAVMLVSGLLFGWMVQTPVARLVLSSFEDTYQALGRGQSAFSVSLQSYHLPSSRLPGYGELVAYSRDGGGEGPYFSLHTTTGHFDFGLPRLAYAGRVFGLPGDTVEVRRGIVLRNQEPAPDEYRPDLDEGRVHPPSLEIALATVPEGYLFVLPDDRSVISGLPVDAGPLVATSRILGRVVVVQPTYTLSGSPGPVAAPPRLTGKEVNWRGGWSDVWLRLAIGAGIIIALFVVFLVVGPWLFPPRCPECHARLRSETTRVYEGETRDDIILPRVDLIRRTCPRCGFEKRLLDVDTTRAFFDRGPGTDRPYPFNQTKNARGVVRAVLEWDQIFDGLLERYKAEPLGEKAKQYRAQYRRPPENL